MSFDRTLQYFSTAIAIVLASVFAIVCGSLIGGGQFRTFALIFAGIAIITTVIAWRARVWLLIPLCWEMTGKIPITGLPMTVRDIAVGVATISFLVFYALKLLRTKPVFDLLDTFVLLNLACIATVYVRNPVGFDWLGSNMVGGRPYFDIFIGFLAFLVLKRAPLRLHSIRQMPFLVLCGAAFVSLCLLVTYLAPSTASILGGVYSSFGPSETGSGAVGPENPDLIGRRPDLLLVGIVLIRIVCSRHRPLSLISPRNWVDFLGAVGGMVAILLSGFRTALVTAFIYIGLASYFQKRSRDVVVLATIGVAILAFVSLGNNRLFSLPFGAQRALSFLPGEWDYAAVSDADASSVWRYEMWRMVLTEEKWIKNKWLGDGFGFTRRELEIMNTREGFIGTSNQEEFLITGAYHSGPLSAVRYVGYIGLLLYLALLSLLSVRAYRLIRLSYGTDLFVVALFVGMPLIWKPFDYIFVFGGFDSSFPETLMMAGLIKLIERFQKQLSAELGTPPKALAPPANEITGRRLGGRPMRFPT